MLLKTNEQNRLRAKAKIRRLTEFRMAPDRSRQFGIESGIEYLQSSLAVSGATNLQKGAARVTEVCPAQLQSTSSDKSSRYYSSWCRPSSRCLRPTTGWPVTTCPPSPPLQSSSVHAAVSDLELDAPIQQLLSRRLTRALVDAVGTSVGEVESQSSACFRSLDQQLPDVKCIIPVQYSNRNRQIPAKKKLSPRPTDASILRTIITVSNRTWRQHSVLTFVTITTRSNRRSICTWWIRNKS